MIKGVNRQIIEVTDTNSLYYEKAYLVVRPQYRESQQAILEKQAQRMLSGIKSPSAIRGRNVLISSIIRFIASAGIGGVATALIFQLF